MHRKLEISILIMLFAAGIYLPLIVQGKPVFAGEFNTIDGSLYAARLMDFAASLTLFLLAAYTLVPRLLGNRILRFSIISFLVLGGFSALEWGWDRWITALFNLPTGPGEISDKMLLFRNRVTLPLTIIPGNLMAFAGGLVFGMIRDRADQKRVQDRLLQEKTKAELDFLKSQMNPHFLFNALNNIVAITRRNQDEEAGSALLTLSQILRYMLYESTDPLVPLEKEIEHIENLIALTRLKHRSGDPVEIRFTIKGTMDQASIAPLILIPFVENGLKHGIEAGKGTVTIDMEIQKEKLKFSVVNSRNSRKPFDHEGIGFANVKKRLQLLYPGSHRLTVREAQDRYSVSLFLKLR